MKVKNNLRKIMFEKEIESISELQRILEAAGKPIARRTLDRIYHNDNNQIHYQTIADLCEVLEIGIGDLFSLEKEEE
ncbi:helix-turn-helix domain-containing protein [Bacillus badius]|uniref:Transcriptional regulator n=1 Tax=Bacillus badius TaxID=1455 RepID=A0ABR5ANN9_BACBA|nr:helix-turn-helix transcriptional regulator [Bacillus badius]KIL72370.1 Transcriptional regulator [Bacillus badius]MED4718268.1 helix-turn-helix transcriptional regulator [Bacillus badius]